MLELWYETLPSISLFSLFKTGSAAGEFKIENKTYFSRVAKLRCLNIGL